MRSIASLPAALAATPALPRQRHSTTLSTRNCTCTARSVAPRAMRRPISRVRSITEASIMFMIPTPPTMSATHAMLRQHWLNVCQDLVAARLGVRFVPAHELQFVSVPCELCHVYCWLRSFSRDAPYVTRWSRRPTAASIRRPVQMPAARGAATTTEEALAAGPAETVLPIAPAAMLADKTARAARRAQ
jgi:hypothetical protein